MTSEEVKQLHRKLDGIAQQLTEFFGMPRTEPVNVSATPSPAQPMQNSGGNFDEEALFQRFKERLLKEPAVLRVLATQPEIIVETEKQVIEQDGSSLRGRIARLIASGFFDEPKPSASAVRKELKRTGGDSPESNIMPVLKDYQRWGFLTLEQDGWTAVKQMKSSIRRKGASG